MWRLLFLVPLLAGCSGGGGNSCTGNLCTYAGLLAPNSGWTDYGTGTGAGFVGRLSNPWTFPTQASGKSVNYVYTLPPSDLAGKTITLNYSVDGNATFDAIPESSCGATSECGPPMIRLFIWENGDTGGEFGRWWCVASKALVVGDNQSLQCAIVAGAWSDVDGKVGAPGTTNPFAVGFTFGGEFAGHGDWTTSRSATFTVNSFTVQ